MKVTNVMRMFFSADEEFKKQFDDAIVEADIMGKSNIDDKNKAKLEFNKVDDNTIEVHDSSNPDEITIVKDSEIPGEKIITAKVETPSTPEEFKDNKTMDDNPEFPTDEEPKNMDKLDFPESDLKTFDDLYFDDKELITFDDLYFDDKELITFDDLYFDDEELNKTEEVNDNSENPENKESEVKTHDDTVLPNKEQVEEAKKDLDKNKPEVPKTPEKPEPKTTDKPEESKTPEKSEPKTPEEPKATEEPEEPKTTKSMDDIPSEVGTETYKNPVEMAKELNKKEGSLINHCRMQNSRYSRN